MKNAFYFLLLCTYIVSCKCEEFPVRQSPIIFLDEINISGLKIIFNDFEGNHLGCFTIDNSTDFIVPDSINQLEGYHFTYINQIIGSSGLPTISLTTYTHVKTNRIKFKYNPYPSNYSETKSIYFTLDALEEDLEFVLPQRSSIAGSLSSIPALSGVSGVVTGEVNIDAEFTYLFLKFKNENFIRYGKYSIPPSNNISVTTLDMDFHSDAAIPMTVSDTLNSNVMINGISDCPIDNMVPLSFKLDPNEYYRLEDNLFNFDTYLSSYTYKNGFDIYPPPSDELYFRMIKKGEILNDYHPQPIHYQLPYKDFDKFQLIIPKENCVAKTNWMIQNSSISWDIYGDYLSPFKGLDIPPECLGLNSPITPRLISLTTFEGSEFSNYEDYLRRIANQEVPFYRKNHCDSVDEFYEEKKIPM